MNFVVAHRFSGASSMRGRPTRPMLHAARLLVTKLCALRVPTRQERADLYIARMPIAVVTASLGGHPSDSSPHH